MLPQLVQMKKFTLLLMFAYFVNCDEYCLEKVVDGLHRPVALEAVDDALLVAEHRGIIRRINVTTREVEVFRDLSGKILTSDHWMDHRGLLSILAVDSPTGKILLTSSSRKTHDDADHDTVVTAIPINENVETFQGRLLVDDEQELMRVAQPSNRYNGGQLLFHNDSLFLTTGDGAMKYNESSRFDMNYLTGKILRMNLTAEDGNVHLSKPQIFASGFRNPWRCAVDTRQPTIDDHKQQLFCGDTAIEPHPEEEIYLVRLGGRYGHPQSGKTPTDEDPIHRYQLATGSAVIGGRVYQGTLLPELNDAFVFGDYVSGDIFSLSESPDGVWQTSALNLEWCQPDENDVTVSGRPNIHVVAFAVDEKGELLVLADDKDKFGLFQGGVFSLRRNTAPSHSDGLRKYIAIAFFYWVISRF